MTAPREDSLQRPMMPGDVEKKLHTFFRGFGDENLSRFNAGLCNALAFMRFYSIIFNLEDKNLKRLVRLMEQDEKTIEAQGKLYHEYQLEYKKLIHLTEPESDEIVQLNNKIKSQLHDISALRETKKTEKMTETEKALKETREKREALIQKQLESKLAVGRENLSQMLQDAKDLYYYAHNLVTVFEPSYINLRRYSNISILKKAPEPDQLAKGILGIIIDSIDKLTIYYWKGGRLLKSSIENVPDMIKDIEKFSQQIPDDEKLKNEKVKIEKIIIGNILKYIGLPERIHQSDYIEMIENLDLYPLVDGVSGDIKSTQKRFVPVTEVFKIALNFTTDELNQLFNNKYGNTFYDEDIIEIQSHNHAILIKKTKDCFELYNPGLYKYTSTCELVSELEVKHLFSGKKDILPIEITVFAKIVPSQDLITRPIGVNVVKTILDNRKKTHQTIDINGIRGEEAYTYNFTSLVMAARSGLTDIVKVLLDAKADFTIPDIGGLTGVAHAANNGDISIINALVAAKATPKDLDTANNQGETPILLAAKNGYENVVKALVDAKVDINKADKNGFTPIIYAIQNDHKEVVEVLVEAKGNLEVKNEKEETALHIVTNHGNLAVIEKLIEAKANLHAKNSQGETALHIAARNGHPTVVEKLLAAKANTAAIFPLGGNTPLLEASEKGHASVVEKLLAKKADLNAINYLNETALFKAAQNGHIAVVEKFLEAKANLEARNSQEMTPLHIASHFGHFEMVKKLLEAKANIEAKNNEGMTPLHIASLGIAPKRMESGELFLWRNITSSESSGLQTINALIEAKADLSARNSKGETAQLIAAQHNNFVLQKHIRVHLITQLVSLLENEYIRLIKENEDKNNSSSDDYLKEIKNISHIEFALNYFRQFVKNELSFSDLAIKLDQYVLSAQDNSTTFFNSPTVGVLKKALEQVKTQLSERQLLVINLQKKAK